MKAMILAAGVGSRLRPLTETLPKALIEINGTPMLEIVLRRLIRAGIREVVINVHHMAEKIVAFLDSRRQFGIQIEISQEKALLDTGGGLKKVGAFFDDGQPFLLHNVDVLSTVDLAEMVRIHRRSGALATLLVQARKTSRFFLFDENDGLCGWESAVENQRLWASQPVESARRLAFNGVHVISPRLFSRMSEIGIFSINQTYLRLAGEGERIQAYQPSAYYWWDIGRLGQLEAIRQEVEEKKIEFF